MQRGTADEGIFGWIVKTHPDGMSTTGTLRRMVQCGSLVGTGDLAISAYYAR